MDNSSLVDINDYIYRVKPDYDEEVVLIDFASSADYDQWLNGVARTHGNWVVKTTYQSQKKALPPGALAQAVSLKITTRYICDHGGVYKNNDKKSETVKKRKITNKSIKVGCTACFIKKEYEDGSVNVVYNWNHKNHNPLSMNDLVESRLPAELKNWITHHVKNHQDWRGIKSLLRHSLEELEDVRISH